MEPEKCSYVIISNYYVMVYVMWYSIHHACINEIGYILNKVCYLLLYSLIAIDMEYAALIPCNPINASSTACPYQTPADNACSYDSSQYRRSCMVASRSTKLGNLSESGLSDPSSNYILIRKENDPCPPVRSCEPASPTLNYDSIYESQSHSLNLLR